MEQDYLAGQTVQLTQAFVDDQGSAIAPSEIVLSIKDENGTELHSETALNPAGTSLATTIPAGVNALADGTTRGVRLATFTMTHPGGVTIQEQYYLLHASIALNVMQNSFQTYPQALLSRATLGGSLAGWDTADKTARSAALEHAYTRLSVMRYVIMLGDNGMDFLDFEDGPFGYEGVSRLDYMTKSAFLTLPQKFRDALCRAQVLDADEMLAGDFFASRRRAGVISETIGESSMFFNSKPPVDLPVAAAALRELKNFLRNRFQIARA